MATKRNEEKRRPRKAEGSALDQAIAAAISAPPLSKKAAQYQNGKKLRAPKKNAEQPKKAETQRKTKQQTKLKQQKQTKQPSAQNQNRAKK